MAAHIRIGDFVIVALPKPLDKSTQPIWKYDGNAYVVARKKYVSGYRRKTADNLYYVELYGAVSELGTPYGFLVDWLLKADE